MSKAAPRPTFSVLGFPVRVTPFFFLIVLFLGAPSGEQWDERVFGQLAIWFGMVFVAVLWHELGHALVMRRFGYQPAIELHGLGGHTTWGRGPGRPTAGQRIAVSLAGPMAGIAVGVVPFFMDVFTDFAPQHWALQELLFLGWFTTFGWGVLNLVPMLPWDGGHVVEGVVDRVAPGKGRKAAAIVTFAVGAVVVGLVWMSPLGQTGKMWISLLCLLSASTAYRALKPPPPPRAVDPSQPDSASALAHAREALERSGGAERLVPAILLGSEAPPWRTLADDLERAVLPQIEEASRRAEALELVGWARLLGGDVEGARRAIDAMRPSHDASPLLAALVAARGGDLQAALDATAAMADGDEPRERARLEAFALAGLGRVDEAMARIDGDRELGGHVDASLFHGGHYEAAAKLGAALFERFGDPNDAYNTACSHARAGRAAEALGWLERAAEAGYQDLEHLEGDPDLADVRALDGYRALRARLSG